MNIAVIGTGDNDDKLADLAFKTGKEIAKAGAVLICGGLGGVMEAACRGARENGGTTVGLLPFSDAKNANKYLSIAIPTGLGHDRNILVVTAAEAVIAIGGKFGTLSEIGFALNMGRPVVGLETWSLSAYGQSDDPVMRALSPGDAVAQAIDAATRAL